MERSVCDLLITPHALLGAALTRKMNSLLWGLPLAYISHFALDAIPNWDVGLTSIGNVCIIVIDGIIALLLIRLLSTSVISTQREKIFLLAGGIFGILPDILSQGAKVLGFPGSIPFESLHQSIQKNAVIYWSLPAQMLISCLLMLWIRYKADKC